MAAFARRQDPPAGGSAPTKELCNLTNLFVTLSGKAARGTLK
jgi:hypothetical protein